MKNHKMTRFLAVISLALLITTTYETIPELKPTELSKVIIDNDNTGDNEMELLMKVSVSPDGKKAVLSKRVMNVENKESKPKFRIYNIENNKFEDMIESPELTEGTAITQMVSSNKVIALTITTAGSGHLRRFSISGSTIQTALGDKPLTNTKFSGVSLKKSANLGVIYFFSGFIFFSVGDLGIKDEGTNTSLNFAEEIRAIQLNPEISSTQYIVAGGNSLSSVYDYSEMKPETNDLPGTVGFTANLNTKKESWVPTDVTYNQIEFNHVKTDHIFLAFIPKQSKAGNYIRLSSSDATILGYIDTNLENISGGVIEQPRNIIGSDYFFTIYSSSSFRVLDDANKIVLVDTSSISLAGSIDYKSVTDKIVPSELLFVIPASIDRVNSDERTWIFSGATEGEGGRKAWASIVKLTLPLPNKCHPDCETCFKEHDTTNAANCIKCTNGKKVLGPSGCECSENCTSCSENNNPKKCKACKEGFYLFKESDVEGEGSCKTLDTMESQLAGLKITNSELEGKVQELKIVANANVTDLIKKLPVTDENGIKIVGCMEADEKGLCKTCMEGTTKDTVRDLDNAESCISCGVSGCSECELSLDGKSTKCVKCKGGSSVQESENGVQSCFKELFGLWMGVLIIFYGWFNN